MKKLLLISCMIAIISSCKKDDVEPKREIKFEIKAANGVIYMWLPYPESYYEYNKEQNKYTFQPNYPSPMQYEKVYMMKKDETYSLKWEYKRTPGSTGEIEKDFQVNIYNNGSLIKSVRCAFDTLKSNGTYGQDTPTYFKYSKYTLSGTVE